MTTNRSIALTATTAIALFLSACATHDVRSYSAVDKADRSVMVPEGAYGPLGPIKDGLRGSGWKLAVSTGSRITGPAASPGQVVTTDATPARYRLSVESHVVDMCLDGTGLYVYDISLIDLKGSSEVLSVSGRGCRDAIAKRFLEAVNG